MGTLLLGAGLLTPPAADPQVSRVGSDRTGEARVGPTAGSGTDQPTGRKTGRLLAA